jgi:rfaE bifunctional protein kinase chain/domain
MDKGKASLISLIDRFPGRKIAVWGDFILDEYLYGKTRRISREAPVLILSYQKGEYSLGGAGNSVLNIKALGADPLLVGVVGQDASGERIIEILHRQKISSRYLIRSKGYQTPIKMRILAGEENTRKQQILRIDKEAAVPESASISHKLRANLMAVRSQCHGLLISDYNYMTVKSDVFNVVLPAFKKSRLPVTLDSRFRLLQFKGITVATPNEPEVEDTLKIRLDDDILKLKRAGRRIMDRVRSRALLITRGSRGMALFERGRPPFLIPVHGNTDIVDVTGAGDTVISVFTLALASGASLQEATRLANFAGGVVVMKKGTATISAGELKKAVSS